MLVTSLFWLFSAVLVLAALGVVLMRNPVYAALLLVLAFFSSAAIWLLLEAEFLAIALVLVYVGAVMVLFLFVVMMLDVNFSPLREGFIRYLPLGLLVGVIAVLELGLALVPSYFSEPDRAAVVTGSDSNTEQLGKAIYSDYLLQFEVAAVILLIAIVAAISLTMRRRTGIKYQDPGKQVTASKAERLRIVSIDSESAND